MSRIRRERELASVATTDAPRRGAPVARRLAPGTAEEDLVVVAARGSSTVCRPTIAGHLSLASLMGPLVRQWQGTGLGFGQVRLWDDGGRGWLSSIGLSVTVGFWRCL